jgi:hypothetical protein
VSQTSGSSNVGKVQSNAVESTHPQLTEKFSALNVGASSSGGAFHSLNFTLLHFLLHSVPFHSTHAIHSHIHTFTHSHIHTSTHPHIYTFLWFSLFCVFFSSFFFHVVICHSTQMFFHSKRKCVYFSES